MDQRSETGFGCIILMIVITLLLLPFLLAGGVLALALAVPLLLGMMIGGLFRWIFPARLTRPDFRQKNEEVPASEDVIDVEAHTVETRSADPKDLH